MLLTVLICFIYFWQQRKKIKIMSDSYKRFAMSFFPSSDASFILSFTILLNIVSINCLNWMRYVSDLKLFFFFSFCFSRDLNLNRWRLNWWKAEKKNKVNAVNFLFFSCRCVRLESTEWLILMKKISIFTV